MEKHTITFGTQSISFKLLRKKVKHININTKPDLTVMVSANDKVPINYIKTIVKKKAPWILKNLSYFQKVHSETKRSKEYVSGESFKYLGKQIRLKIEESSKEYARYQNGYLYLYVKNKTVFAKKKHLFDTWLRQRSKLIFQQSLNTMLPKLGHYKIQKPSIKIRLMKARWGSYIKNNHTILLNFELIKAPKFCIDYVILHELIHFIYRNHDSKFFNLITAIMPDWKERKKILDEEVIRSL